jgi:hypothetical protein
MCRPGWATPSGISGERAIGNTAGKVRVLGERMLARAHRKIINQQRLPKAA